MSAQTTASSLFERAFLTMMLRERAIRAGMPEADVDAAIKTEMATPGAPGGFLAILQWILANAPALISEVMAILKLFGL